MGCSSIHCKWGVGERIALLGFLNLILFGPSCWTGANSQCCSECDKLKRYLQQVDLVFPANAMLHSVGSIFAQVFDGTAAATCLKQRL